MNESPEDKLFRISAEMDRENRMLEDQLEEALDLLQAIWKERQLTQPLWTKIAEFLEYPEDETPIVYTPEFVTQSDLLKLERRIAKLERGQSTEPLSIPT